jgi:hypothetical protein
MKNKTIFCLAACAFLAASCDQYPIFFSISKEVKPKEATIQGSPSKIVALGGEQYIANGNIFTFDSQAKAWHEIPRPPQPVRDVAAAGALFALGISGSDTALYRQNGEDWDSIPNPTAYTFLQSVFSANGQIFVAARNTGNSDAATEYAILHYTGGELAELKPGISELRGVVYHNAYYYFAATKNIYAGTVLKDEELKPVSGSNAYTITGIIETQPNGEVIAVTSEGFIYKVTHEKVTLSGNNNVIFTGALAVWENVNVEDTKLLLLGIHASSGSYTYGYREMLIGGTSGILNFATFYRPGQAAPSSVSDTDKYDSTIGKHSLTALYVHPTDTSGGVPLVFASTQKDGLWSYRDNEWNAED